jgi:hypothetical protein
MEAPEAIALINDLIAEADAVRSNTNLFDAWRRKSRTVLDKIFGPESQQANDLLNVNFEFFGISTLGDNAPHIRSFHDGLEKSKEVLRSIIWEIDKLGVPVKALAENPGAAFEFIKGICFHFHSIARQLRHRHDNRPTLDVADEYDVQDLLHALLRQQFKDIRAEEWTPSYAGMSARMDFLLKAEQIVVEVKMTRKGLDAKKVGEELIIDIAHYQGHPNCKMLVCFVYDPDCRIANPAGLENDLSKQSDEFVVRVVIAPRA